MNVRPDTRWPGCTVVATLLALLMLVPSPSGAQTTRAADPAAAEREYRVARRLAIERSPQARAALERVIELDPGGELADDALLDLALLERPSVWPEQIGSIGELPARRARAALRRVVDELPRSDRAREARLLLGLMLLEPLPGRDPDAARQILLSVSTDQVAGEWAARARLVLAWSYEIAGDRERALGAYRRLVLDAPPGEITARARAGCGRLLVDSGAPAEAAVEFDRAIRTAAGLGATTRGGRELAVRRVLEGLGIDPAAPAVLRVPVDTRAPIGFAGLPGGGVLIAERRKGQVSLHGADGAAERRYLLARADAVGVDPDGRIVATAGDTAYRLVDELWRPLGSLGEMEQASVVTAAADGRLWLVDRRGQRLATLAPGAASIEIVWTSRESRLVALATSGVEVLAADERGGRVLRIDAAGDARPLIVDGIEKPISIATDGSGRIAVLDDRSRAVHLFDRDGRPLWTRQPDADVFRRPTFVTLGSDGAMHLLDASAGFWGRWP